MATHCGGTGQPLEENPMPQEQDNDIPTVNCDEDMDNFENMEHENHTTLKTLTWKFDNLWQRVETAKCQPTEAVNQLEHELHRLPLVFRSSAPPEPLDEVLQQYTETLCTAQKQTTFTNMIIQDIQKGS